MNRRELLLQMSALGLLSAVPGWGQAAVKRAKKNKTLVLIFQRGAVDGLSMVSPFGDSHFNAEIRPSLFVPQDKLIHLNSYFGLHPAMIDFKNLWDKNLLSVVHQVGSPSTSRSHFDSQDFFESGTPDVKKTEDGFLSRAAKSLPDYAHLKLAGLSVQPSLPRSIMGEKKSLSFDNLNSFNIRGISPIGNGSGFEDFFETALDEVLKGQNKNSVAMLESFSEIKKLKLETEFPKGQLSLRLQDVAKIIKSGMQIPFVVTEVGGWDTHVNQGGEDGALAKKLQEFSASIAAFVTELGPKIEDVTVITVTEFGRTVKENGGKGTDHGHGSCYFVIDSALKRKNIVTNWKDLKKENLYEERDLPVTTDFRTVFSEILCKKFDIKDLKSVFPDFKGPAKAGIFT